MIHKNLLVASFLLILSGCATVNSNTAVVTISSQPAGAMIYEGQKAWGMSPQVLNFQSSVPNGQLTTASLSVINELSGL